MNRNLKSTLRIPSTEFPQRGNLVELDRRILDHWQSIDLSNLLHERKKGHKTFTVPLGPPFTNGNLHMGHGLSFALKSIVIAMYNILGYKVDFVLGWDCHGLPIETKIKALNTSSKREFYEECRKFSNEWLEIQKKDAKKLCYIHNDGNYSTIKSIGDIYNAFSKLLLQGDVLIKNKPIIWSTKYKCNIPDIDIEYNDKTSHAIYQYCPVINHDFGLLIFTTTPWSTFDNMYICLNKNFQYSLVEYNQRKFYVATDSIDGLNEKIFKDNYKIISTITGNELLNKNYKYSHFTFDKQCEILHGDHVSTDGTGLVHTAPAHGPEDYQVVYDIYKKTDVICDLVSIDGFVKYNGQTLHIIEDVDKIMQILAHNTVFTEKIVHSYPFYKDYPLIYKTSEQIYLNIDRVRDDILKQLNEIITAPTNLLERLKQAIATREEWCVSRNRTYGVPLALFVHKTHRTLLIDSSLQSEIIKKLTHDPVYFLTDECVSILPERYKNDYEPYLGVLDCWFDSACVSPVIMPTFAASEVSDVYIEGKDQLRGWFNSSAFLSMMLNGKLPYKAVIGHGFVVTDMKSREKLSKSKENSTITLNDFINKIGLDVFMILIANSNFKDDVVINENIRQQAEEKYRKFRGVLRYLCSVLEPGVPTVKEFYSPIERAWLYKLHDTITKYIEFVKSYELHFAFNLINNFIVDFSATYLNACKDCSYADGDTSRRSEIIAVCFLMLSGFLMMLCPFIARTCEEVFLHIKKFNIMTDEKSVHLLNLTTFHSHLGEIVKNYKMDSNLYDDAIENIIPEINVKIEALKQAKEISKNSDVEIIVNNKNLDLISIIEALTNAANVISGHSLVVNISEGIQCARCSKRGLNSICPRCEDFLSSIDYSYCDQNK